VTVRSLRCLTAPAEFLYTRPNLPALGGGPELDVRAERMEVPTMISVRTKRIRLGVLLAGLLTATAACTLVAEMRGAPDVKPTPTAVQVPAPQLAPMSAPATASGEARSELTVTQVTPVAAAVPAASESTPAEPASNNADDPRAVIDWLLNRSR
jgi:hypothetical protein